jgi:hypothetical protein
MLWILDFFFDLFGLLFVLWWGLLLVGTFSCPAFFDHDKPSGRFCISCRGLLWPWKY